MAAKSGDLWSVDRRRPEISRRDRAKNSSPSGGPHRGPCLRGGACSRRWTRAAVSVSATPGAWAGAKNSGPSGFTGMLSRLAMAATGICAPRPTSVPDTRFITAVLVLVFGRLDRGPWPRSGKPSPKYQRSTMGSSVALSVSLIRAQSAALALGLLLALDRCADALAAPAHRREVRAQEEDGQFALAQSSMMPLIGSVAAARPARGPDDLDLVFRRAVLHAAIVPREAAARAFLRGDALRRSLPGGGVDHEARRAEFFAEVDQVVRGDPLVIVEDRSPPASGPDRPSPSTRHRLERLAGEPLVQAEETQLARARLEVFEGHHAPPVNPSVGTALAARQPPRRGGVRLPR